MSDESLILRPLLRNTAKAHAGDSQRSRICGSRDFDWHPFDMRRLCGALGFLWACLHISGVVAKNWNSWNNQEQNFRLRSVVAVASVLAIGRVAEQWYSGAGTAAIIQH